jgi:hypothetical protein
MVDQWPASPRTRPAVDRGRAWPRTKAVDGSQPGALDRSRWRIESARPNEAVCSIVIGVA